MAIQPQRKRRLELPAAPSSSDPTAIQRYLNDVRRLTMDEFNRLSGDFYDFRADVIASATIPLAAVAAIAVTPGRYEATFTWENPVQPIGLPTHVRVRIAEQGDTWLEFAYPITTWTAYGLSPSTAYTFQIQLVRREAGTVSFVSALRNCPSIPVQVESLSEIRSRSFVTLAGIGVPTPDDGDPVIPIPDTDNPGPVGGDDCWWEWQIQVLNLVTFEWDDTIYGGFVDGDAGEIDLTAIWPLLDPLRVYRTRIREICDGVPGPWEDGPPWTGGDDWLGDCGGHDAPASYSEEPYSSADLWVIPYMCFVAGEGLFVREYLSGIEIITGAGFQGIVLDADGEYIMGAPAWSGSPVARLMGSTYLPALLDLDNSNDFTIYIELRFPTFPVLSGGVPYGTENIISIGDGRINFNVTWDASNNWGIQFSAPRESGGNITLNSPLTNPAASSGWTSIKVIVDNDGTKTMVVNGVTVAEDITGQEIRLDGMTGAMQMRATPEMKLRKFYGWSQLINEPTDSLEFSDDFNRDNSGSVGNGWHETNIEYAISGNTLALGSSLSPRWINNEFNLSQINQWNEVDIDVAPGLAGLTLCCDLEFPASMTEWYQATVSGTTYTIQKYVGGTPTILATDSGPVGEGTRMRFQILNGELTILINDVEVLSVTDEGTLLTGAYHGIVAQYGSFTSPVFDNYEAGVFLL